MYNCHLKHKLQDKTSHRFYKHLTQTKEQQMEGYTIYTEVIFAIKEDLTSKTRYLKTNEHQNDSVLSLNSKLSTRSTDQDRNELTLTTHKERSYWKDV